MNTVRLLRLKHDTIFNCPRVSVELTLDAIGDTIALNNIFFV